VAGSAIVPLVTDGDRPGLGQLVEAARAYADAGMADNTRRAYGADWRTFTSWCASVGASPLPAEPATIALYLTAHAPGPGDRQGLAVSTLARHLAAIRRAHRDAGAAVPDSGPLRQVWSGIQRSHGRPPRKKRALVLGDLRRVVGKCPKTLAGARDRAILLLGFAAALRRSEVAAAVLDGPNMGQKCPKYGPNSTVRLAFVTGGLEVRLDRSKGDQLGDGAVVGVPYGKTRLCPVSAVRAWLDQARITGGPVFRGIDRHGRLGSEPLSGGAIALIVKRACERADLDPSMFGGHSMRSGLITEAAANDVAPDVIMRQSRHAKFDTMRGYIQGAERFKRNAAAKVGL
jgi:integrase